MYTPSSTNSRTRIASAWEHAISDEESLAESADPSFPSRVGAYRVDGRLGAGGMGEVYRGWDDKLDRPVALKRIAPDAAGAEESRQMFRREAQAVARLHHGSIVQVFELIEGEDGDWLVMELVDGKSLRELCGGKQIQPARVVEIARGICTGLAVAHAAGIVHRDLKLDNVMLTASGEVRILDFGIYKRLGSDDGASTTLSVGGRLVGTVAAMSPEQAAGEEIDHRSDLFSLGSLLYELLTGEPPFVGRNSHETLSRICIHKETPAHELAPEVSESLSLLIGLLLEKDPARRPQSAEQTQHALAEITAEMSGVVPQLDPSEWTGEFAPNKSGAEAGTKTVTTPSMPTVRTLLLNDLVDSTKMVDALGDERAAKIFEQHDRKAREILKANNGREIDKSDGFLMLFERPMDAVRFALGYHAMLEEISEQEGVAVSSRVGIHVGEVVLRVNSAEDVARGAKPLEVEGLAKAIAARFMTLAGARQTLISRGIFDLGRRAAVGAADLPAGLEWVRHGRYLMKGVEEPVEVFEVGPRGEAPLTSPVDSEKARRVKDPQTRHWRRFAAAGFLLVSLGLGAKYWYEPSGSQGIETVDLAELENHQLYEYGQSCLRRYDKEGSLDRAVEVFQIMLERDESSASAYAGLARAYWMYYAYTSKDQMWLGQAQPAARRAVELDPFLAAAHVSLGLVHTETGDAVGADARFNEALQLNPQNADAYYGLGRLSEAEGDMDKAEESFRKALELRPDNFEFQLRMGSLYARTGQYARAEAYFSKTIELAPDSVLGYRNLAGVYYQQGQLGLAASTLQESLEIQPNATVYSNLGTLYFAQGFFQKSAAAFEKAVAMPGGANRYIVWANLGDAYRWTAGSKAKANDAYLRAIQLLKEQLEAKPNDTSLRTRLAMYHAKRGEKTEALAAIEMGLRDLDANARFRVALVHELCGHRERALEALAGALQAGYSLQDVKSDPELLSLREDYRYHRMVMRFEDG